MTAVPTIRVGGYAPPGSVHSQALVHFRQALERDLGDGVRVEVLDNVMDLGRSTTDLFDMVSDGELAWCYFSTSYLGASVPALQALEIPFLFDTCEQAHAALDGPLGAALSDATRRVFGFEVLGYWDNGLRHLTNARRPIRCPDDAAGLSIRTQPNRVQEALFRAWGMEPVPTELSEGIRLIAAGRVDAQENPLANAVTYGVDHRYVTLSGHLYGARGLYANPDLLAALPPEVDDAVRRAARDAIEFQRQAAATREDEVRRAMEAEGREVTVLTDAQRAAFRAAAEPIVAAARARLDDEVAALLPRSTPGGGDEPEETTWPI